MIYYYFVIPLLFSCVKSEDTVSVVTPETVSPQTETVRQEETEASGNEPTFDTQSEEEQEYLLLNIPAVCNDNNVRIRDLPSIHEGSIIGMLHKDDMVHLKAETRTTETLDGRTASWYELTFGEITGWVFGAYIDIYNEAESREQYRVIQEKKQEITDLPVKLYPDYENGNGTVIGTIFDENTELVLRKHVQRVQIGNMARDYSLIIYDKPSLKNGNAIGNLKLDDYIDISQIAEVTSGDDYYFWANISTDNKITGWIFCRKYGEQLAEILIPYFDNRWEITGRINTSGKLWTVRKMVFQKNSVWRMLDVRDKPGLDGSKVLFELIPKDTDRLVYGVEILSMTEEEDVIDGQTDHWIQIKDEEGRIGWVFGGYTDVERGGAKYRTPEALVHSVLGWH